MSHTSPAPGQLYELREWLLDRIDGGEEMRGEDGLVSNFIRQIDAQDAELADLKQRLLPQYVGRAERAERDRDAAQVAAVAAERDARFAEHERDVLLEQLIEARSAIQRAYGCLWRYTGSSNPMFLQARKMLLARLTKEQQAIGIRYANEIFGPTTEHEILHSDCSHDAAPSATAAPVAWCVGYDDPRMGRIHSDPTMHKPQAEALAERNGLALVSLYAGSLSVREGGAPIAKESA